MTKNILLLTLSLAALFATQAQASQLTMTSNLSKVGILGSVDDFLSGDHDGYGEGGYIHLPPSLYKSQKHPIRKIPLSQLQQPIPKQY